MSSPVPPSEAAPGAPAAPGLIFDWKHRPRTWARLTFWLTGVLLLHLAAFVLFRVRTPAPARVMPVPASVSLAPAPTADPADPGSTVILAGRLSPEETADLELPEHSSTEPYVPSFSGHTLARQPWPARPERAAWPEVSRVSQPVLPPAAPAPDAVPVPDSVPVPDAAPAPPR